MHYYSQFSKFHIKLKRKCRETLQDLEQCNEKDAGVREEVNELENEM